MRNVQTSESNIPLRRLRSSSSTIAVSTYSNRTSNDEQAAPSIFSRSPTNSTCTSTVNSKEEPASTRVQPGQTAERKRVSFRETARQVIRASSQHRGRSPARGRSPPTTSTRAEKTTRRSSDSGRRANVNVHTYAGRHTNQWLFGDFSVTETIKKMIEKKDRK